MHFYLCYCTCLLSSTVIFLSNYVLLKQNVPMDMSMERKLVYLSDDASLEWHALAKCEECNANKEERLNGKDPFHG